ncbi:hypothetical protein CHLRE_12g530400v5 [Chlamydomonas reinhardtii]|uniref:Zinc transporter n=2 Tax=Chlamydomonas reinhardtii TaxID=3055 RepID=A0A2K3D4S5_CHLRE|nr:uncharacterized protein CHLRE_12g530400v5 [Chlamydomonas reinhardtii]PNW75529.1 hypothetical protein CHLRE_12g530400v5 [Chlamydomonas reinhardtii]
MAAIAGALFIVLVPVKNDLFLAASLAFAAGVMLYISFVDIYAGKAIGHFEDAGYTSAEAFTYATICFFAGFPISWVLDKISHRAVYHGSMLASGSSFCTPSASASCSSCCCTGGEAHIDEKSAAACPPCSHVMVHVAPQPVASGDGEDVMAGGGGKQAGGRAGSSAGGEDAVSQEERTKKLVHLGLLAAMAMALHNMPEGLVTFVGYMDSITSGITTAVAIAIHNIPEGMVIASAVYFGTGQRLKAVMWTALAALSEPLGGLIGLAVVCGGSMTDTVFGILFGLVGGIMVYISLKELLPGARRFDPKDKVTTALMAAGGVIMACSLVAIAFSQPQEGPELEPFMSEVAGGVTATEEEAMPLAPPPLP